MGDRNDDIIEILEDLAERCEGILETLENSDLPEKLFKAAEKYQSWVERMKNEYDMNSGEIDDDQMIGALDEFEEKLSDFEEMVSAQSLAAGFDDDDGEEMAFEMEETSFEEDNDDLGFVDFEEEEF